MILIGYLALLGGSLFLLGKSAHYVIIAITKIGHKLGISEFITGFVILGIATSFPEIFVGIQAALSNTPQLSLGNVFGANIVLLTLIAGLTAILNHGVDLKREFSHSGRMLQIILLILAPILVLIDASLARYEAIFLLVLFTGYIVYLIRQAPKDSPPLQQNLMDHKFLHIIFLSLLGIAGLIISSRLVVFTSLKIADIFSVPAVVIGILMLSVGTNLPEISVVLAAIKKKHTNLVIGDILGSAATNTLVVAIVGLIKPFKILEVRTLQSVAIYMVIAMGFFFWFTKSKNKLSTTEAGFLIAFYIGFVVSQLFLLKST